MVLEGVLENLEGQGGCEVGGVSRLRVHGRERRGRMGMGW